MNANTVEVEKGTDKTTFEVPALKKFEVVDLELLDPEKAEAEAKKLREETLPKLQEQVTINLSWLEEIGRKSREAQDIFGKQIKERREWLADYLKHEFGPYRRATWLAMLLYYFSKPFKSQEEAKKWVASLYNEKVNFQGEKGYLHEAENGPLTIFGKTYAVNTFANLGEPEIRQLRRALADLENRVKREEWLAFQNKSTSLLEEGTLSTKKLSEGKAGLFSALSSVNGSPRPEGVIVVHSNGKGVFPHQAIGSFREDMEELKKLNEPLLLYILNWEALSPDFFTKKARFSERKAELMMEFWKLLKNGIVWKAKKERVQAWREELQKLAADNNAIAPEKFLPDKTQVGFCFLEVEGRWDWYTPDKGTKETPIYNLFFVVERHLEENSQPAIRLVKYPPWLKGFFSECGNKYWPEGEKFEGLPQNLRMVLQKIWGQFEKRSRIQNHA